MHGAQLDLGEVTRLLRSARDGEPAALDRLIPLLYEDLRRLARRQLGHEFGERTLNATALVHESYLKLGGIALAATDRAHFLAMAARAMRQVVECRFFGGMEEQEIAAALSVSERTVQRDWVRVRAWLYRYFCPDPTP
jgi:DNA-directed RNA polymerase specialized sigma24 family protein